MENKRMNTRIELSKAYKKGIEVEKERINNLIKSEISKCNICYTNNKEDCITCYTLKIIYAKINKNRQFSPHQSIFAQ